MFLVLFSVKNWLKLLWLPLKILFYFPENKIVYEIKAPANNYIEVKFKKLKVPLWVGNQTCNFRNALIVTDWDFKHYSLWVCS